VTLQKAQAGDNLASLRALEPGLPCPRLINGLPAYIKPGDRKLIKEGHPSVIRFWSSLFSIYRILKCSYKLKISTITGTFSGKVQGLNKLIQDSKRLSFFETLPGFEEWQKSLKLAPSKLL
jgi:hypothetical protein